MTYSLRKCVNNTNYVVECDSDSVIQCETVISDKNCVALEYHDHGTVKMKLEFK